MIIEILVLAYLILLGFSLGNITIYDILYERRKRRLGFVNKRKSMIFNLFFETLNPNDKYYTWFITLCPGFNLVWFWQLLTFKKTVDGNMDKEFNDGDIVRIETARNMLGLTEEGNEKLALKILKVRKAQMKYDIYLSKKKHEYDEIVKEIENTYRDLTLPEKVVAVRNLQRKSNMVNRVIPFSEYGPDEKIAMLLAELEIAYKEKAKLEGTDLDKEVKLLLDSKD